MDWSIAICFLIVLATFVFLSITAETFSTQPVERRNHEQAYRIDRFGKG